MHLSKGMLTVGSGAKVNYRIWSWDDRPECGRMCYVYQMAAEFLRAREIDVPDDLVQSMVDTCLSWRAEIEESQRVPADMPTSASTHEDFGLSSESSYVSPADLPIETELDSVDIMAIRSIYLWSTLSAGRQQLLTLRMAVSYVRDQYGEMVPRGLVTRTVEAARREAANS